VRETPPTPDNYQERFKIIENEFLALPSIEFLNYEQVQGARDRLIKCCQGFEEEIEFIVSSVYNMIDQREYDLKKTTGRGILSRGTSQRLNVSFAESLFLGTHYLLTHRGEKSYLADLLNLCEAITTGLEVGKNSSKAWESEKRGLIGQVGIYNFMEKCGLSPRLASPKDDAFKKVDFWGELNEETLAVQGKCAGYVRKPAYLDTESKLADWLAAEVGRAGERHKKEATRRAEKIWNDYLRMGSLAIEGKSLRPVVIILPWNSLDHVDGSLKEEYFKDIKINN